MSALQKPPSVRIADADRNAFFPAGLEYNTPARGMWNIVHTGMLIPGAHQIYVCAQGCLRGVILTAAEMNVLDRLSTVSVTEQDLFDGSLETDIIDGVSEILQKLPQKPPVILLYLSCIHLFAGVDFAMILRALREQYPDTAFVDCYMTPTMRQTIPPAVKMAEQLYAALQPRKTDPRAVGIIGNDRKTDPDSDLMRLLTDNGFTVRDIALCESYDDYLRLAECALNITYTPIARRAGASLQERLGIPHLELPAGFSYAAIEANLTRLCDALNLPVPDFTEAAAKSEQALAAAREAAGNRAIAIDFTAVTRPFELAALLLQHGFRVKYVIADSAAEEREAFDWLQANCPDLEIIAAANVNMLHFAEHAQEPVLAVGQKAAYYFASDCFVNMVMNGTAEKGGLYGFSGIAALAELMADACRNPKDRRAVLRHKGLGLPSCLSGECCGGVQ